MTLLHSLKVRRWHVMRFRYPLVTYRLLHIVAITGPNKLRLLRPTYPFHVLDAKSHSCVFSEGRNGRNKKPHKLCIECYSIKHRQDRTNSDPPTKQDTSNTTGVGTMFCQVSGITTAKSDPTSVAAQNATASASPHSIFTQGQC